MTAPPAWTEDPARLPLSAVPSGRVSPGPPPRGDLWAHPRRAELLRLVQASPGLSIQGIARRLQVPRTSLRYHLEFLLRKRILEARPEGREVQLFEGPFVRWQAERLRRRIEETEVRTALAILAQDGTLSRAAIARRMRRRAFDVTRILRGLVIDGGLTIVRLGLRRRYELTDAARLLMRSVATAASPAPTPEAPPPAPRDPSVAEAHPNPGPSPQRPAAGTAPPATTVPDVTA